MHPPEARHHATVLNAGASERRRTIHAGIAHVQKMHRTVQIGYQNQHKAAIVARHLDPEQPVLRPACKTDVDRP